MVSALTYEEDGTPFIQLGEHKLKLDIEELYGEFLERAQKELRETDETREQAIANIRKLLESKFFLLFIIFDINKFFFLGILVEFSLKISGLLTSIFYYPYVYVFFCPNL